MIEQRRGATPAESDHSPSVEEEAISPFDAAAYAFQIVGELSALSRDAGLERLARALERARDAAADALVETRGETRADASQRD